MKRLLICAALAALSASPASADPLHLAFGIDLREGDNPFENLIVIRDHHISHYHVYFGNHGTDPGGHTPVPIDVTPGNSEQHGVVTLASMNVSPDAESDYLIPSTPEGDFHLELVGAPPELGVFFEHDGDVTPMLPGDDTHLSVTDFHSLRFSLAEGAALGIHQADFRIIDENGNYFDSVEPFPNFTFDSDFYILVNAVPEPGAALLGLLAVAAGVARRG